MPEPEIPAPMPAAETYVPPAYPVPTRAEETNRPPEPTRPLSTAQILAYSAANIGCGAFYSFNNYILPLFLQQYTSNAVLLGLMGSSHSVEGAIIQPLVGSKSDHLRTKLGRRRPFLLIFFTLSALFLALTPLAGHVGAGYRLPVVVGVIFLFTVLFNVAWDPYQALMPDITPPEQRGRVTGVWGLLGNVAQAAILPLALILGLGFGTQFYIVAALMLITNFATCAWVREPNPLPAVKEKRSLFAEVGEGLRGLRTLRQAAKGMAVIAISGAGIGAVVPNLSLFVKTVTHCSNAQAQTMGFILMIATAVFVLPFGWITDRIGPKRVIQIAFALIAVACVCALFVSTLPQVAAVMVIAGIGNAAQAASVYPLLTDLVPGDEVGFYTGFQSTMHSLAQPVTVVITGILINRGGSGYRIVFVVCAVCIAAAMALLGGVNRDAARDEITKRGNREQETGNRAMPASL